MTLKSSEYKSDESGIWISREALDTWNCVYAMKANRFVTIDKSMYTYFSAKEELLEELLNL